MAVQAVNDDNFEAEVLKSDQTVIVDFWAEWCGPCKQFLPTLEEFSSENDAVKVVKVNIEESPETPTKYGVRSIPTLVMFKNGEATAVQVGSLPKTDLATWVENNS
ncbi:MAG: thioredoxin [Alphaproteobacteria bacterium]|nr:thioredoxin [Alphaproteobacteria bacterium]MDD9919598.1 thioredoxin [Alphaproteobacteria bacterium]